MSYSILWTTVPAGRLPGNLLRLALVASPRVEAPVDKLSSSPLADWPALVRGLGALALQVQGQPALRPLTRLSAEPGSALWLSLLPGATRVKKATAAPRRLITTPNESYVQAAKSIDTIYANPGNATQVLQALAGVEGDARISAALPASARTRGPQALDRLSGAELAATTRTLAARGFAELAVALPIAAHARALRTRAPQLEAGAPLAGISTVDQADFHQLVGLLLDHPVLAVAVGLRIDFSVAAQGLDGVQLVRVVGSDGQLLDGPVVRPQPWSKVRLAADRWVMEAGGEVRDGMLDLSPDPERFLVTSTDVTGLAAHLESMKADTPPGAAARLPVRRNAGLTLAQANRPSAVVEAALDRSQALHNLVGAVDGAPVLDAGDVTTGYRIDVATDGGAFRSLMRRRTAYKIGSAASPAVLGAPTSAIPDSGEGKVQRAVAIQQPDADGVPQLRVGEEVSQWDGWALAAPRPGRTVTAEPGSTDNTGDIGATPLPGVPMTAAVSAEPGSVPRLRFGHDYQFRARAVCLGGVSLPESIGDSTRVSAKTRYLRTEAVAPPTLVHRRRNSPGESATRLVVRSDGSGTPIGELCERHVAAPKSSVQQAEWHAVFDAAIGPESPERTAARAALLRIARREAGSFMDPTVLDANGVAVPVVGIGVVTNDPSQTPDVQLPLRRGDPLPNGVYVVHDTPQARLPYLPDVPADGAAVAGLGATPVRLPYAGTWPDVAPGRLVLHPSNAALTQATVKLESGQPVLHIELPAGAEHTVMLSSTIRADRLGELDLGPSPDIDAVLRGQSARISALQPLTLVHAVQRPVGEPRLVNATSDPAPESADPAAGAHGVLLRADLECHRDTTGRVDLEATWTETIDTGSGPVRPVRRTALLSGVGVERGGGAIPVQIQHLLDAPVHRSVSYTPIASTRFAEYFVGRASGAAGQRRGPSVLLQLPNRAVPPEPDVHSMVPIYASTRTLTATASGNLWTLERRGAGLRVFLRRQWNVTGDGEQLGVMAFASVAEGNAALAAKDGRLNLVSRWGSDPLEETNAQPVGHVTLGRFGRRDTATSRAVPLLDSTAAGQSLSVAAHAVEFDAGRDLWFADVDLSITETRWPFVRLGLVRYQPVSTQGCHVSRVVRSDFAQLPAKRTVEVRRVGEFGVSVVVKGSAVNNSSFTIRQERRLHAPTTPGIDLYADAGVGTANGWSITDSTADVENALVALTLSRSQPIAPNDPVIAELFHGRVVVEERQNGMAVAGPGKDTRVIYTETIDRSLLGIGPFAPQIPPGA